MPSQQTPTNVDPDTDILHSWGDGVGADLAALFSAAEFTLGNVWPWSMDAAPYVPLQLMIGSGETVGSFTADGRAVLPLEQPWGTTHQGLTPGMATGSTTSTSEVVIVTKTFLAPVHIGCNVEAFAGRVLWAIQSSSGLAAIPLNLVVKLIKVTAGGTKSVLDTCTVALSGTSYATDAERFVTKFAMTCGAVRNFGATDRVGFEIDLKGRASANTCYMYFNCDFINVAASTDAAMHQGYLYSVAALKFA